MFPFFFFFFPVQFYFILIFSKYISFQKIPIQSPKAHAACNKCRTPTLIHTLMNQQHK